MCERFGVKVGGLEAGNGESHKFTTLPIPYGHFVSPYAGSL